MCFGFVFVKIHVDKSLYHVVGIVYPCIYLEIELINPPDSLQATKQILNVPLRHDIVLMRSHTFHLSP